MRIISRRLNEALIIGDDITLTVLEINGNMIRLGITASKEISVYRGEDFALSKTNTKVPSFDLTLKTLLLRNFLISGDAIPS